MVEYLDVKVIVSSKSSVDLRLQWISLYYELPHKKKKLQILDIFGTGENAASRNGTNSWFNNNNLGEVITPCVMSKRVHPSVLDVTF